MAIDIEFLWTSKPIFFIVFFMTCFLGFGSELVFFSQLNPRLQGKQVYFCLSGNHNI